MSVKKIIITILTMFSLSVYASDNKVYIEQIGDNTNITITQDGSGNTVKGLAAPADDKAYIKGDNSIVAITQDGTGNTMKFKIDGGGTGTTNKLTYSITGNNATSEIRCNSDGSGVCNENDIKITQNGNTAIANVTLFGDTNKLDVTQTGGNNQKLVANMKADNSDSTVSMTGGAGNEFIFSLGQTTKATNTLNSITTVGATNKVNLTQDAGGSVGHKATLDVTGSSNTFNITQAGTTGDSIVSLKITGSGNTYNITSNTN